MQAIAQSFLYFPKDHVDVEPLRRELTVTPRYQSDEVPIRLYHETAEWFGVPLYHYRVPPCEVWDRRVAVPTSVGFRSTLRPEQARLIEAFQEEVKHGKTGFIIEAKPGFGKTVTGIKMISLLGQTTLVVVPRSNLIRQWEERLLQHSTLKRSDIGWVEGGKGVWIKKKVVIGLVHSLVLDRLGTDFRRAFGCIIYDEVDRSVPPQTFAPVVAMFPAKYRIGMSAVLKRADRMEVVFQKHMGQVYLRGGDEGRMVPKVLLHYYSQSSGYVFGGSKRMNRRGMLISRLAENYSRNHMLANYIHLIWKSQRRCLVLSDRKRQLMHLRGALLQRGIPDRDLGYYMRSLVGNRAIPEGERRRVAQTCKVILATYGMIALGTDIPELAGLVYATPQSETEQTQGRIERAMVGKKEPVVVDIVDTYYKDAMDWALKRQQHYQSHGLTMKRVF